MIENTNVKRRTAVFELPQELSERIESIAGKSMPAVFIILLSGINYLLYHGAKNNDIAVGIFPFDSSGIRLLKGKAEDNCTFKEALLYTKELVSAANKSGDNENDEVRVKAVVVLENICSRKIADCDQAELIFRFKAAEECIKCNLDYDIKIQAGNIDKLIRELVAFFKVAAGVPQMKLAQLSGLIAEDMLSEEIFVEHKNSSGLTPEKPRRDSNIFLLNKGSEPDKCLLFIRDGTGGVEPYIELCTKLRTEWNCWGIKADGLKNPAPENFVIENMASNYLKKVRNAGLKGPYRIISWSNGGAVAFELVRQIEESGGAADFIAVVDTEPPDENNRDKVWEFDAQGEKGFISRVMPGLDIGSRLDNITDLRELYFELIAYFDEKNLDCKAVAAMLPENPLKTMGGHETYSPAEIIQNISLLRSINRARLFYFPKGRIKAQLHFIRPEDSGIKDVEKWNRYCSKSLKLHNINGDHYSVFKSPDVNELARLVNSFLDS